MKSLYFVLSAVILSVALAACAKLGSQEATATPEPSKNPASAQPAPEAASAPAAVQPERSAAEAKPDVIKPVAKVAPPAMVQVPKGTAITIVLADSISTATNKAGDTFTGSLAAPLLVNGQTVAPRGAAVKGRVIDAKGSGRVKGTASISLALTSITAGQKSYAISTRAYSADADTTKKRDAGIIGGGGGVGAAIGAIAGGKKGAVTGAIIGGAAGTGAVLATKGKEVEFPSETKLTFSLDKAVELPKAR